MNEASSKHFHVRKRYIERWRRGGKGHRISGDTAGRWFQQPAISCKKSSGGYRRTTILETENGDRRVLRSIEVQALSFGGSSILWVLNTSPTKLIWRKK